MPDDIFSIIKKAGQETKTLNITYRKLNGEVTKREVEPYEIRGTRFFGFDLAKDEIRHFIVSGILEAKVTSRVFNPRWPIKV